MRLLIQRVKKAQVEVNNQVVSQISQGLLVFVGIAEDDKEEDWVYLCAKLIQLRIFSDEQAKMNLSLEAVNGSILVVSQFTLHAHTRKGNRPSYIKAAPPMIAAPLFDSFVAHLRSITTLTVETGIFGADMQVSLINDGPVTIWMDSKQKEY
jgi:D-tyrosyl-tRNA(Tyr) deacylase